MIAKELIVLFSALVVSGCADPVRYDTPAQDPNDPSLSSSAPPSDPGQKQASER